jgi:hypothetical protein
MNSRLKTVLLSGSLALSLFMTKPIMADESNKRTEFQFSAPVEIPGHVLTPGKYVFELLDSSADRNIVQVLSEDTDGNESLVATLLAIPDYTPNTPDKPIIHFEERGSGSPEAIHSWFYPGDNTGWEFVYPKEQNLEAAATPTPNSAPVAASTSPSMPSMTHVREVAQKEPAPESKPVEEQILIVQNETPAQLPVEGTEIQTSETQVLPQAAGNSDLEIVIALAMLGSGLAALFVARRKLMA